MSNLGGRFRPFCFLVFLGLLIVRVHGAGGVGGASIRFGTVDEGDPDTSVSDIASILGSALYKDSGDEDNTDTTAESGESGADEGVGNGHVGDTGNGHVGDTPLYKSLNTPPPMSGKTGKAFSYGGLLGQEGRVLREGESRPATKRVEPSAVVVDPEELEQDYATVLKKIDEANSVIKMSNFDIGHVIALVHTITDYFTKNPTAIHPASCACKTHASSSIQALFKSPSAPTVVVRTIPTPSGGPRSIFGHPPGTPKPVDPQKPTTTTPPASSPPVIKQDETVPRAEPLGLLHFMPFYGQLSAVAAYFLLGFLLVSTVGMTGLFINMRLKGIHESTNVQKTAAAMATSRRHSIMRIDV